MTTEEKYCYYSRHFNIMCENDSKLLETFKLNVLLNPGPDVNDGPILIDTREDILEIDLANVLEELKLKTLLSLDV